MRRMFPVITFLFVAMLAVGCSPFEENSAAASSPGVHSAAKGDKAESTTKVEATSTAKEEYPYEQKAEYIETMKKELAEIQVEIDRLSAKVDKSTGSAKVEAKNQLAAVREQWIQTRKQLDKAENATESNWDDVKFGIKNSFIDMKDSFEKTRQWLSDKIEP